MTKSDIHAQTIEERNIINDCFSNRGGDGYNDEQLIPSTVYSMGKLIANAERTDFLFDPVTFGLVASNQVNAAAVLHPTHGYVVGINMGLVNRILDAAFNCWPIPENTHPVGTLAFAQAQIAISFIIEHEVAHILNGHLLLHKSQSGPLEMTMRHDDEISSTLSKLDIQTLEMDADACAVTRTVGWAIEIHRASERGGRIAEMLKPFFDGLTETEVILNVIKAITLAIESLSQEDPELELCVEQSHLPRTARIYHATELLADICEQLFDYSLSERVSIEIQAGVINEVIKKISGDKPTRDDVAEFYLKPHEGYIHTLTKHWTENLSPKLEGIASVSTTRNHQ